MNRTELSDESNRFIEKLRLYLFSKGKKQREIEEIAEELAEHLYEAEQNGKSVEQVVGNSPQEYMDKIEAEMNKNPGAFWFIPFILLGPIIFWIYDDLLPAMLYGEIIGYSLFNMIGTAVISILLIIGVIFAVRYTSKNQLSGLKENVILTIPIGISMLLYVAIYFLDGYVETPLIIISSLGKIILFVLVTLIVIGISIWAKTWILPAFLIAWNLPPILLELTSLGVDMQALLSMILTIVIAGSYIYFEFQKDEKQ
ncbi:HAAS domain-containing protein [Oceanobacillus sp. J11TS1]|uniref:HAAS domain-containing protein n=1 Tax=Oceanobacillus sp. J11TS1 TaxID=2807191 RepID=UPI001B0134CC|nr:hypothetical protein [Oceanobacillus sp. J11TS1]GIO23607.1 NADH dehydrogenase [Oceanobacillus sp. J11TS1]